MADLTGEVLNKNLDENFEFDINKVELLDRIKKQLLILKSIIDSNKAAGLKLADYYKVYCDYEALSVLCLYLTDDLENNQEKKR